MSSARAVLPGSVRDLVQSGEGVVETSEGVFFVRGVILGEAVLVRPLERPGRIRRANLVRVTEPATSRIEPPCAHAARCGGCPVMHMELSAQRALKVRFLRDALVKAGVDDGVSVEVVDAALTLGYRRRARLAFRAGKAGLLGFRRERTHEVVDVDHCIVLAPALDRALVDLRSQVLPLLAGEGEVGLALGAQGGAVVVLQSAETQTRAVYAAFEALVASGTIEGAAVTAGGATVPARIGAPEECSLGADGQLLRGTVGGFSQAHEEINHALTERVIQLAAPKDMRVLELYAGHGNFTVMLAAQAQSLVAVEQDGPALKACRQNLDARGLQAKLFEGDVRRNLGAGPLDVVVLDPPRTGAPSVLTHIRARKPKRIVYVSCDPATLARDLAELKQGTGPRYHLDHAACFEMFPQTADLESVVRLVRC